MGEVGEGKDGDSQGEVGQDEVGDTVKWEDDDGE